MKETITLKALAHKVLERNQQGNLTETESFHNGKLRGEKVSNENIAYCYWLKSAVADCHICFEIGAKIVNYECRHFKDYFSRKIKSESRGLNI